MANNNRTLIGCTFVYEYILFAAVRFGAEIGDPNYDPRADLTGPTYLVPDGIINMRDISLIAAHFGDHL